MARTTAQNPWQARNWPYEALRLFIVTGCALALIAADLTLPL